jgi:hypothetical protein
MPAGAVASIDARLEAQRQRCRGLPTPGALRLQARQIEIRELERLVRLEQERAQHRPKVLRRDVAEALLRLAHAFALARRQQDVLLTLRRAAAIYAGVASQSASQAYVAVLEASIELGLERAAVRAALDALPHVEALPVQRWATKAIVYEYLGDSLRAKEPERAWRYYLRAADLWRSDDALERELDCLTELEQLAERRGSAHAVPSPNGWLALEPSETASPALVDGALALDCAYKYQRLGLVALAEQRLARLIQVTSEPTLLCGAQLQLGALRLRRDGWDPAHWELVTRAVAAAAATTEFRWLLGIALHSAASIATHLVRRPELAMPLWRRIVQRHEQLDEVTDGTVPAYLALAEWLSRGHEHAEAMRRLDVAERLARGGSASNDATGLAQALLTRAAIAARYADAAGARHALARADDLARRISARHHHGRCWRSRIQRHIGDLHAALGEAEKANERWGRAATLAAGHADHLAEQLHGIAHGRALLNDFAGAARDARRAGELFAQVEQHAKGIVCTLHAVEWHAQDGRREEALDALERATADAERLDLPSVRAQTEIAEAHLLLNSFAWEGELAPDAHERAQRLLRAALARAREAASPDLALQAAVPLVDLHSDPSAALAVLREALDVAPPESASVRLRLLQYIAEEQAALGERRAATSSLTEARALAEQVSCSGCRVCVCNVRRVARRLAELHDAEDRMAARAVLERSVALARQQSGGGHPEALLALVHALVDRAQHERGSGERAAADATLAEARAIAERPGLPASALPYALLELGNSWLGRDLSRAIDLYRSALGAIEARAGTSLNVQIPVHRRLAEALTQAGEHDEAFRLLLRTLALARSETQRTGGGRDEVVAALIDVAAAARDRDDLDDAGHALAEADGIVRPWSSLARSLRLAWGHLKLARGELEPALSAYDDAYAAARRARDWGLAGGALVGRIMARHAGGTLAADEHLQLAQEALELYERVGDIIGTATAHRRLASVLGTDPARAADALRHLGLAIELSFRGGWRTAEIATLSERAALLAHDPARIDAALDDVERALALCAPHADSAAVQRTAIALEQQRCVLRVQRGTDFADALVDWERAKARQLDRDLAHQLPPLSPQRRAELTEIRAELDALAPATGSPAMSRRAALRERAAALRTGRSPRRGPTEGADSLNLAELRRELLGDDVALLAYVAGDRVAAAFCVTDTAIAAVQVPAPLQLGQQVAELVWAAQQGDLGGRYPHGHDLYLRLVAPFEQLLGERDLIVVPDGPLHLLPFQLMLDRRPGPHERCGGALAPPGAARDDAGADGRESALLYGSFATKTWTVDEAGLARELRRLGPFEQPVPYLVRRRAISVAPSAAAALALARRRRDCTRRSARSVAVFAHPVPGSREHPPPTTIEANRIAAIARGQAAGDPLVCVEQDATVDAVRSITHRRSPRFRFVHVAAHAEFFLDDPELSGIELADDGSGDRRLRLLEIAESPLRCELVTLSCCDTARGRLVVGEGVLGLTRGFLLSGAAAVCGTLWQIPDRTTPDLMEAFYERLFDGETPARALAAAQRSTIERGGRHALPLVWAAFALTGGV